MKKFIFIFLILFSIVAKGQNLHFSQFEIFPLATNPALAGNTDANYRLAAIHRQQWKGINSLFETSGVSVEKSIKNVFLPKNDLGIGISFINDEMGDNLIDEQHIGLSLAYHHTFARNNRAGISPGIQVTMKQTQVDYSSLQFGSQYEYFEFNPDLSSGEPLGNEKYMNVFLNAGIAFKYQFSAKVHLTTGVSAFNLLKPQNSAFGLLEKTISGAIFHSMMEYRISDIYILYPALQVIYQGGSYNPVIGAEAGFNLDPVNGFMLLAGAAYRNADALIFKGGFKWKSIKIKGAYDMTTSQLNNTKEAVEGSGLNAFEIGLIWEGWSNGASGNNKAIPCEIF